jgi:ParB family transcriptional regulator, chromosome partitioning protein
MSKARGGLGKGLEALIPATRSEAGASVLIDVETITPNPHQPRREWNEEELADLSASIREHGVLQPIILCRNGSHPATYTLIAGERRWRAAKLAGLTRVPAVIKEVTEQQMLALAIVENIQRSDLNALEEAHAYRELMKQFSLTQEQVAGIVGRSRAAVANALRLLSLPGEIQTSLSHGEITEGHARALLSLKDDEERCALWHTIVERGLSVRDVEKATREKATEKREAAPHKTASAPRASVEDRALEDDFRRALGTKVNLIKEGDRGRLVVYFYSDEELQAIYEKVARIEE